MKPARRALVLTPACMAASSVLAGGVALAQSGGAARRIGILSNGTTAALRSLELRLLAPLAEVGWREGENLRIDRAYRDDPSSSADDRVAALLRRGVDLIVTTSTEMTISAARATRSVPIVFLGVHYPLESGLVGSYAHPGGNVTGPALFPSIEISIKRLQMLRNLVPTVRRATWVWPDWLFKTPKLDGGVHDMGVPLLAGARTMDIDLTLLEWKEDQPMDGFLEALRATRPQMVSAAIPGDPKPLVQFAARLGWPTAFPLRYWVVAGGLFSYGPTASESATTPQRAANYVDRILRGVRPQDLPVQLPSTFELVLNRATAAALGIVFPAEMRVQAAEVLG
jgi:putative tryptophan/tyrosine transport system substrate-binding protein